MRSTLLFSFSLNAFFDFFLHISFRIIELTNTTTDTSHQLRNFTTTEQNKHDQDDQDPLSYRRALRSLKGNYAQ